jgi:hypothetical protein
MKTLEHSVRESNPTELETNEQPRKVGVEIVKSAELSAKYFRRWRAVSHPIYDRSDVWSRRLAQVLR